MAKFLLDIDNALHAEVKQKALDESKRRGYRVSINTVVIEAVSASLVAREVTVPAMIEEAKPEAPKTPLVGTDWTK